MTRYQRLFERISRIECWHRRNGRPEFGAHCWRLWEEWRSRVELLRD